MAKTDKVDKKIKKVDKKTGKKCGAFLTFLALAFALVGCSTTGGQPARSQSMNNEFRDCTFIMASEAVVSNGVVQAKGGDASGSEMFTQTQKNEGSETNTPTASPTNTTDIKPQTDVNTTGGRTAGVLETLIGSFGTWLTTPSGKEATATAAATSACANGACTNGACANGTCSDGSCSTCSECSLK